MRIGEVSWDEIGGADLNLGRRLKKGVKSVYMRSLLQKLEGSDELGSLK